MPTRRRTDSAAKRDPIQDAIALRAYELHLARGREDGRALDDWLEAERQLSAAATKPQPAQTAKAG
jgi:hypothetical protein